MSSYTFANGDDASMEKLLLDAVRRYCRSIELCSGYLRGFYGLKVVSQESAGARKYYITLTTCRPLIDFWKLLTEIANVNRVRKDRQRASTLRVFHLAP